MMSDEGLARDEYLCLAKLAEQAERYQDMAGYMEKIMLRTPSFKDFTVDERSMFSVAYKNCVGSRRSAWRVVFSIEQKDEVQQNEADVALIRAYRARIESELSSICGRVIGLLDSHLIPSASSGEAKVFYLKMKGDYHRYLAEFKVGEEQRQATRDTAAAYMAAQTPATVLSCIGRREQVNAGTYDKKPDIAHVDLGPTHPIRLGLDLNFSVFYYDIMNSLEKASSTAKQAVEAALADLDNLGSDFYKDSVLILQLLRDNLTFWTADARERT